MPDPAPMYKSRWARRKPRQQHNWNHKQTTTERGYGYAWQRLRASILQRDRRLCQVCLQTGKYTPGEQVDHIIPKAQGGTDDPDNLQTICPPCHAVKTARESNA